ncbi:MAG TPA: N-acetylglucosamine-6-phosphate deacetylase [Ferruginibacter sp.]|nr:N-acetylglucosamine-6-phosphate deacetylase [Ferruginibacter sp.]
MAAIKAIISDKIFTSNEWLFNHAVIISAGKIIDILPAADLSVDIEKETFYNSILAPAFIDLQIYGAYEKLFAVYPNTGALDLLNIYCNKGGAAFCMPTVATNKLSVFYTCIDTIRQYKQQGGKGILGLHAEGPWISKEKRGAHIESLIYTPTLKEVEAFLEYGKDIIKIITLAPEVCNKEIIALIHNYGIKVFAGHSNADYDTAMQAFDNGIDAVTHLYNAMSPLQHRNPGMVGAAFNHQKVMASIIADGYHVDYAAIKIAKKIMGSRLFAITDAVTATNEGYYKHELEGDKYTANNILSGSALTMYKAFKNLVIYADIDVTEALRMCSLYPAQVMQMDNENGRIAKGYKSNMVLIPEGLDSDEILFIH